jgi:antitoxin (DNA-binding transcriptional repressor) of toxin-antitoxin stability system
METVIPLEQASEELDALARRAEAGEELVLTRGGEPVIKVVPVPPKKKGGIDWEAGERFLKERGIKDPFPYIAPDFDDPLPEDFLLRPLPPER